MKSIKINDNSTSYYCDICEEAHLDIEIQVIVDGVEVLNLKHSDNPGKDNENNFLIEESNEKDININIAYHFIYNQLTKLNEEYLSYIEYLGKLMHYCELKNIRIET